jgi:hypothetical protein
VLGSCILSLLTAIPPTSGDRDICGGEEEGTDTATSGVPGDDTGGSGVDTAGDCFGECCIEDG